MPAVKHALGLVETTRLTPATVAIDALVKAATVRVLQVELNELSVVTAAIEAGRSKVNGLGKMIAAHVVARPIPVVLKLLPRL